MVVIVIVLIFNSIIILTLVYMASKFESPEKAKRSIVKAKVLSVLIQVKSKAIYTIEVIVMAHVFKNGSEDITQNTAKILVFVGAVLCLVISSLLEFVLSFILNIRVRLIDEIPWCSQKSVFPFIMSLLKLAQGISLAVAIPQASIIVLFLLSTLTMVAYIYLQPFYNKKVYFIHLVFLSILFAEYFHLVVASFDSSAVRSSDGQVSEGSLTDLVTVLLFFLSLLIPAFA